MAGPFVMQISAHMSALDEAMRVALPGGKMFVVIAKNLSRENKYVKSETLNGKPLDGFVIRHSDIMAGGELVFEMAARP